MAADAHDLAARVAAGMPQLQEELAALVAIPGMTLPAPIEDLAAPAGIEARWPRMGLVADEFRTVMVEGFAEDEEDERAMVAALFAGPRSLEGPAVRAVVARADGAPVAAGASYAFPEATVIGFIATIPEARGRGLGTYVTGLLANAAFADGAEIVELQASPMGLPVYTAMGFERVAEYGIWLPPEGAGPADHM